MAIHINGNLRTSEAVKGVGGTPRYATIWLGPWTRIENGAVPDLEAHLARCETLGVDAHVQFFMAGDQINDAFFGGDVITARGADLAKWWALIKAIGKTIASTKRTIRNDVLVTLEPEYWKADIPKKPARFDTAWRDAAWTLKGLDKRIRVVSCPGEWADHTTLPNKLPGITKTADAWATQHLRCVTRDSYDKYIGGLDSLISKLTTIAKAFPDTRLIVTDFAYSTYGGLFSKTHPFPGGSTSALDNEQKSIFVQLVERVPALGDLGVTDFFMRDLQDTDMNVEINYYGWGERGWGVMRKSGTPKPAHEVFLTLARGTAPDEPEEPGDTDGELRTLVDNIASNQERLSSSIDDIIANIEKINRRLDNAGKALTGEET